MIDFVYGQFVQKGNGIPGMQRITGLSFFLGPIQINIVSSINPVSTKIGVPDSRPHDLHKVIVEGNKNWF